MLLTALVICLAGTAGVYVRLRSEFPRGTTLAVVVLLVGATPLVWYTAFEPTPIDLAAFALTAWLAVAATAIQGAETRSSALRVAAWIGVCAVPLAVAWWSTRAGGSLEASGLGWSHVLFSPRRGFLSWTPIAYVSVIGTVMYVGRSRAWSLLALAVLLGAAWLVGSSPAWVGEPAFGARPMMSMFVLLAPGLACFIDFLLRRPAIALVPVVALPLLWNHLLMVQYTIGMLPKDEPISFARMVRQQAELQARTMPMYPFAFPANVWFAWREGVPVDRYDTLALEPLAASADLALDRGAERFLLEGWSGPTAEGEGQGWWIGERRASVVVPLAMSDARAARVTVVARSRFEEPTLEADLTLLVNGHEVGNFSPPATEAREVQFTVPASALRDGLNKVSIISRGTHPVDPSDTRPPGPVARRAGRSAWPVAVYRIAITPL